MIAVPFALYDAFSETAFGGSQAGIVSDAAKLDDETRRRIAKEFGAPATCFVTATGERYSDLDVNTARREAELFDDCMRKLGYARVPVEGP